jgi:hypothetical protein
VTLPQIALEKERRDKAARRGKDGGKVGISQMVRTEGQGEIEEMGEVVRAVM